MKFFKRKKVKTEDEKPQVRVYVYPSGGFRADTKSLVAATAEAREILSKHPHAVPRRPLFAKNRRDSGDMRGKGV